MTPLSESDKEMKDFKKKHYEATGVHLDDSSYLFLLKAIEEAGVERDSFWQKNEEKRLEKYKSLGYHKGKVAERNRILALIGEDEKVCGCDEDSDPEALGYHTKECDMSPYHRNALRQELREKINQPTLTPSQ